MQIEKIGKKDEEEVYAMGINSKNFMIKIEE